MNTVVTTRKPQRGPKIRTKVKANEPGLNHLSTKHDGESLIFTDLGGVIHGYQGRLKDRVVLSNLGKKGVGSRVIVFSTEQPKYAALMTGELPIALERFLPLQENDPAYAYSTQTNKTGYSARFNLPGLLLHSFTELWEGKLVIEFDDQFAVEVQSPRELKFAPGRRGKPENIKYFLDAVSVKAGLDGLPVLSLEGWALSTVAEQPVTVELYFDGEKKQSTVSMKMRPDVLESLNIQTSLTPGFVLHQKVASVRPKVVSLQLNCQGDGEAIKFEFDKVPGASQFIDTQDTVFQDDLVESSFKMNKPLRRFFATPPHQYHKDDGGISIIIPTRLSTPNIFPLVEALRRAGSSDEIIIIGHDLGLNEQNRLSQICDVYINVSGRFNWSKFNNRGAARASRNHLLFLNDDVLPISPNWRNQLLATLNASDSIGVVGARLVGKDLRFQHDGIELYGCFTHHVNIGSKDDPVNEDVIGPLDAVTGAFLAVRSGLFASMGGFDESLDIIGNDVEFCMRLGAQGYFSAIPSSLYFYHAEGSSRSNLKDNEISKILDERLPLATRLRVLDVGRKLDIAGEPILIRQRKEWSPQSILFIKIDHIGDFYTALPAMKIVRGRYQDANISLICSPEVAELAHAEGIFDEVMPLRVFNKISMRGLEGRREIPKLILDKSFDIAIDFRKHDDAREIVKAIQAKLKFVFKGLLPFTKKNTVFYHGHHEAKGVHYSASVLSELSGFANFIMRYLEEVPSRIFLPDAAEAMPSISERKVIRLFPLSGNNSRAYPVSLYMQFAILHKVIYPHHQIEFVVPAEQLDGSFDIDRVNLLKEMGVGIVTSTSLGKVLELIRGADVVVTNNTGPMWMAANHNVPTIAVFSGVVSPAHWVPKGVIQVVRDVSCSPCHIASAEQCTRNMFCLNSIDPSYISVLTARTLSGDINGRESVQSDC